VSAGAESEPTDVRAVAEAVADVLAERGLVVPAARVSTPRVLDARQVGLLLGRDRQWVYDHAAELGGSAMAMGPGRGLALTSPCWNAGSADGR
jgi:hypothetical protein